MKKSNKGFTLLEALVVSTFVLTTLIFLYIQFSTVKKAYDKSFTYNTVPDLYNSKVLSDFIKQNGYQEALNELEVKDYIDITNCSVYNINSLCSKIIQSIDAKQVILTNNDISVLQNKITTKELDSTFSPTFKKFIVSIDSTTKNGKKRLLIKFEDKNKKETFASVTLGDYKESEGE